MSGCGLRDEAPILCLLCEVFFFQVGNGKGGML